MAFPPSANIVTVHPADALQATKKRKLSTGVPLVTSTASPIQSRRDGISTTVTAPLNTSHAPAAAKEPFTVVISNNIPSNPSVRVLTDMSGRPRRGKDNDPVNNPKNDKANAGDKPLQGDPKKDEKKEERKVYVVKAKSGSPAPLVPDSQQSANPTPSPMDPIATQVIQHFSSRWDTFLEGVKKDFKDLGATIDSPGTGLVAKVQSLEESVDEIRNGKNGKKGLDDTLQDLDFRLTTVENRDPAPPTTSLHRCDH